jgi:hypothetical protein
VNVLKGKYLLVIALILVLSGGRIAMAHGGDMQHTPSTSHLKGSDKSGSSMEGMDMSGSNSDMEGMDMSGSNSDMEGMDMSGSSNDMQGMDMGHEPVKETPANVKVLGTYGAVNLAFILVGIWNKWFRRKGDSHGNA